MYSVKCIFCIYLIELFAVNAVLKKKTLEQLLLLTPLREYRSSNWHLHCWQVVPIANHPQDRITVQESVKQTRVTTVPDHGCLISESLNGNMIWIYRLQCKFSKHTATFPTYEMSVPESGTIAPLAFGPLSESIHLSWVPPTLNHQNKTKRLARPFFNLQDWLITVAGLAGRFIGRCWSSHHLAWSILEPIRSM